MEKISIEKAKRAFCKVSCNSNPPISTCESLGACKAFCSFVKLCYQNNI